MKIILQEIGSLSVDSKGWVKKLCLVQEGRGVVHYDVRRWSSDRELYSEGVKLTREEAIGLRDALNDIDFGDITERWE